MRSRSNAPLACLICAARLTPRVICARESHAKCVVELRLQDDRPAYIRGLVPESLFLC